MPQMSEMMEGSLEGCVYCFLCFLFYPQEIFKFFLYINNFQHNTDLCLTQSEILFFFHYCIWKGMEMAKMLFSV